MNRRILNSTYGGVGGRGRQLPLLPDCYVAIPEFNLARTLLPK